MSVQGGRTAAAYVAMTAIWSTTWLFIKEGVADVPPFFFAATRLLLAAVVMLGVLRLRKESLPRSRSGWRSLGIMSLFMVAIPYACTYIAEQEIPSGLAAVIFATIPVLVAVLAHFQLPDDRLSAPRVAGISIAFAGVAVLGLRGVSFGSSGISLSGPFLGGVLLTLVGAASSAYATILSKRHENTATPLVTTTVQFLVGGLILVAPTLAFEARAVAHLRVTGRAVVACLYLTIVGSCIAFSLYFWLVRRMRATSISLVSFLIPVLAVSVGAVAGQEAVTVELVSGLAAILAGAALVQFSPGAPARGAVAGGPPS